MEISVAMESSVTCNSRVAAVDPLPRGVRPVHDVPESLSGRSDHDDIAYQQSHSAELLLLLRLLCGRCPSTLSDLRSSQCKRHEAAADDGRRAHERPDPVRHIPEIGEILRGRARAGQRPSRFVILSSVLRLEEVTGGVSFSVAAMPRHAFAVAASIQHRSSRLCSSLGSGGKG